MLIMMLALAGRAVRLPLAAAVARGRALATVRPLQAAENVAQ
jgi:hypothetical protein